jgi:hypothetical protein
MAGRTGFFVLPLTELNVEAWVHWGIMGRSLYDFTVVIFSLLISFLCMVSTVRRTQAFRASRCNFLLIVVLVLIDNPRKRGGLEGPQDDYNDVGGRDSLYP